MQVSAVRKPEAGRHKGDLGDSVAKTGVRAGLRGSEHVCSVFILVWTKREVGISFTLLESSFIMLNFLFLGMWLFRNCRTKICPCKKSDRT